MSVYKVTACNLILNDFFYYFSKLQQLLPTV